MAKSAAPKLKPLRVCFGRGNSLSRLLDGSEVGATSEASFRLEGAEDGVWGMGLWCSSDVLSRRGPAALLWTRFVVSDPLAVKGWSPEAVHCERRGVVLCANNGGADGGDECGSGVDDARLRWRGSLPSGSRCMEEGARRLKGDDVRGVR